MKTNVKYDDTTASYELLYSIKLTANESKIWFYAQKSGFIMEIERKTGIMRCISSINDLGTLHYRTVYYFNGKLYLLPFLSTDLYIYDIQTSDDVVIKMDDENCYLTGCIEHNSILYMFGPKTPYIYKYNTLNDSVYRVDVSRNGTPVFDNYFWTESFIKNDILYIPLINGGIITLDINSEGTNCLLLRKENEVWILFHIEPCEDGLHAIYADEALNIWTLLCDYKGYEVRRVPISIETGWNVYPYIQTVYSKGNWITFPYNSGKIHVINDTDGKVHTMSDNYLVNKDKEAFGGAVKLNPDETCLVDQARSELIIVTGNDQIQRIKLVLSSDETERINNMFRKKMLASRDIINELATVYTLDNFIEALWL